jgi:hypothetical protein
LIKSDLHDFLINPSSWNKAVGICTIGQAKTFSTVTFSRTFARAKDNLWIYMGFNNFPRPTFKVTTLCQVFERQLGPGNG